jgi:hypothetical protein
VTQPRNGSSATRSTATPQSDGQPSDFIVNPELAIHTQLDDLNITLAEVLIELRVRPTGRMVPLAGSQTGVPPTRIFLGDPWFGFTLTNDGPNDLQYNVGDAQEWCILKPNESIQTDMRQAILSWIVFQCAAGLTANWRLTGIR